MSSKPIAITMGDPAGIGVELALKAAQKYDNIVIYGDRELLLREAAKFTAGFIPQIRATAPVQGDFSYGVASGACGVAACDAVKEATLDALSGKIAAMVTAPMNKYAVNLSGLDFSGHTEFIAELCGVADPVMMQSAGDLRVVFVTTHIPLAEVSKSVTAERIKHVTKLLEAVIIAEKPNCKPKIAVAAINPHAGENGFMGKEDEQVVKPTLDALRSENLDITGPFPPDTLFIASTLSEFDGVVSMYHDQGHIPFKMLAFDRGVNSTLGLPIIRTSPDHGTAFEIAGRGIAHTGSLFTAVELAQLRAKNRS